MIAGFALGAAVAATLVIVLGSGGHSRTIVVGPPNAVLASLSTSERYCVLRRGMTRHEVARVMRGAGRPSSGIALLLFDLRDRTVRVYPGDGGQLGVVYEGGTVGGFAATGALPGSCPNG